MKNIGYYSVKTFSLILTIFLILVCVFFGILFVCQLQNMEVPSIGPFKIYVVLSPSMEPKFKIDDAVIVVSADPNDLRPGDIITFTVDTGAVLTHRITQKELTASGYVFKTKGDNSGAEDAWVTPQDRIIGKYFVRVPKLKAFLNLTEQRPYIILILVAIILLIQFICGVLERKLKPAAVAAVAADTPGPQLEAAPLPSLELPVTAEQAAPKEQTGQRLFTEGPHSEKGSASDETEE
jgi:signal peptidase